MSPCPARSPVSLEGVIGSYRRAASATRAGTLRNPSLPLRGIALTPDDANALAAFLRALNEDYD